MDGWITIGTELNTKSFDKQIQAVERKIADLENILKDADIIGLSSAEIEEVEVELEKLKNKLVSLNQQKQKLVEKQANNFASNLKDMTKDLSLVETNTKNLSENSENISKSINNISRNTESAIKKVGRLVLGVFSIASAYRFASQASGTLAQYDEQYAANLEYIRFALAQGIAPVLRYLVDLAGKLLGYLNYILNAWFGINMFANASASAMNKGANSAAKMKKQLAGFDEMNVLNENGTTGAMGAMPSMDLSQIQGEVPSWLKWIAENGNLVREIITGIGIAIGSIKLANLLTNLGLIGKNFMFLRTLGIGIAIYGIIQLVKDLTNYLETFDESLENNGTTFKGFGKIVQDVGLIILGIGTAFLSLPAVITGACIVIFGIITQYRDQILGALQTAYNWLTNVQTNLTNWFITSIDTIKKYFGLLGVGIVGSIVGTINFAIELVKGAIQTVMHIITGLTTGFKQIFDGILMIFRGNFKEGFISIAKGIANIFIGIINGIISGINAVIYPIRSLVVAAGKIAGKSWTMNTIKIPTIRYLKTGGIVNLPGRGVPVGMNTRAGEAGAEGVIPLTDSQAMETLGQAIGKYININLTNITKLNNRQIAKEQKRINNQMDFAYNS